MEENFELVRDLKRKLNSIEHMLYVSSKYTRTTEMLKNIMANIVSGYEQFFAVAFEVLVNPQEAIGNTVQDKIQMLNEALMMRGISVDLSDYFLLKRLLLCEFDKIGEYRKNLSMVSFIDGEEYIINIAKLHDFYENLKEASQGLYQLEAQY
jgi:hypothetical protein